MRPLPERPEGERWRTIYGIWQRGGADVEFLPDPFAHSLRPAGPVIPPVEEPKAPRRRWWRWGFTAFGALLLVTLLWLIVTAPLSRALEPLDDPAMLLLSAEGRPIARRGAVKDEPVEVAKLDPADAGRLHRHRGPPLP